jgi:hypothetical protein
VIGYLDFLTGINQKNDTDTTLTEFLPDNPSSDLTSVKFIIPSTKLYPVEVYLKNQSAEYVAKVIKSLQEQHHSDDCLTMIKEKISLITSFFLGTAVTAIGVAFYYRF